MTTESVTQLLSSMKPDFLRSYVGKDEENESKVKSEFMTKLKKTASKIPFLDEVVALWCCTKDPKTPKKVKTAVFASLAYFILPTDLIADFVPGIGYMDDAMVIGRTLKSVHDHVTDEHRKLAREHINHRLGMDADTTSAAAAAAVPSDKAVIEEVQS